MQPPLPHNSNHKAISSEGLWSMAMVASASVPSTTAATADNIWYRFLHDCSMTSSIVVLLLSPLPLTPALLSFLRPLSCVIPLLGLVAALSIAPFVHHLRLWYPHWSRHQCHQSLHCLPLWISGDYCLSSGPLVEPRLLRGTSQCTLLENDNLPLMHETQELLDYNHSNILQYPVSGVFCPLTRTSLYSTAL